MQIILTKLYMNCVLIMYLQVGIMIFLGYFLIYIVRYNLSVHIVDMVQISKRELRKINLKSGNGTNRKLFNARIGVGDFLYVQGLIHSFTLK